MGKLSEPLLEDAQEGSSWGAVALAREQLGHLPIAAFLAVLSTIFSVCFGMLLVPEPLSSSLGVPLYLLSTGGAQIGCIFASKAKFTTGGSTLELVPILQQIAATIPKSAPADEQMSTLVVMYGSTSLVVGLIHLAVSRFRLAGIFRCVPIIVLKSALTGIGLMMTIEAVKVSMNVEDIALSDLLDYSAVAPALLAALLIAGLKLVEHFVKSPAAMVVYLGSAAAFFTVAPALGLMARLPDSYWFEQSEGSSSPFGILGSFRLSAVHFSLLPEVFPEMLGCAFVHALATVTDLASMEAIAEKSPNGGGKLDLNAELGAVGVGNLLSALLLATPSYLQLSVSVTHLKFVSPSARTTAAPWVVLMMLLCLFMYQAIVSVVPRPLVGAFMGSLGVGFLVEGGLETLEHTASYVDAALVFVTPAVMVSIGLLDGLLVALLIALLHFVTMYSLAPIVRFQSDGALLVSNTARAPAMRKLLAKHARRAIKIVSLRGFLMFGSAPQLTEALAETLASRERHRGSIADVAAFRKSPWFIVVDLRACQGVDYGAVQELLKLQANVESRGGKLCITMPPTGVALALERALKGRFGEVKGFDETLRVCEEALIEAHIGYEDCAPDLTLAEESLSMGHVAEAIEMVALGLKGDVLHSNVEAKLPLTMFGFKPKPVETPGPPVKDMAKQLLSMAPFKTYKEGEVVWRPQDIADHYLIILKGELVLERNALPIETLLPGGFVGFLFMFVPHSVDERVTSRLTRLTRVPADGARDSVFGDGAFSRRETTLTATADTTVLIVSAELLLQLGESYPELERHIINGVLNRAALEYRHWIRHAVVANEH